MSPQIVLSQTALVWACPPPPLTRDICAGFAKAGESLWI